MRHITPAEPQGYLGLITLRQEPNEVAQLDLVASLLGSRTKLHFLVMDLIVLAFGGMSLLVLFEQEFAAVHDAADRRFGGGCDLDQIQFCRRGHLQSIGTAHHSRLTSRVVDDAQGGGSYFFI